MHCPRCGIEQPSSAECIGCGIIFEKYVESLGRKDRAESPTPDAPPPNAPPAPQGFGPAPSQPGSANPTTPPGTPTSPLGAAVQAQVAAAAQEAPTATPATDPFASQAPDPFASQQPNPYADTGTGPSLPNPFETPNVVPTRPSNEPVLGAPRSQGSETPTVVQSPTDTMVPANPGEPGAWDAPASFQATDESDQIRGNVHDMGTVPVGAYDVASPGADPATAQPMHQEPAQPTEQGQPRQQETRPRTPKAPESFKRKAAEQEAIHPLAAGARVLAAIACLGIAVLMMINGKGLMSVMPYVIMVAYGCAALWGLTTYRGRITVRQFAIEMAVLVAGTLALRAASPEMFAVEDTDDVPAVRAVIKPHLPKNPLGRYTEQALEVLRACDELMSPLPTTDAKRVDALLESIELRNLVDHHELLGPDEQARVSGIQKRTVEHAPKLAKALEAHRERLGRDAVFRAETDGSHDEARELRAALIRAEGLRARILVVPDGASGDSTRVVGD